MVDWMVELEKRKNKEATGNPAVETKTPVLWHILLYQFILFYFDFFLLLYLRCMLQKMTCMPNCPTHLDHLVRWILQACHS